MALVEEEVEMGFVPHGLALPIAGHFALFSPPPRASPALHFHREWEVPVPVELRLAPFLPAHFQLKPIVAL